MSSNGKEQGCVCVKMIPFEFENKKYEIRICGEETNLQVNFQVRVFYENEPANGYIYRVDLPTMLDFKKEFDFDIEIVDKFIKMAKADIFVKRWEKLLELLNREGKIKKEGEKV